MRNIKCFQEWKDIREHLVTLPTRQINPHAEQWIDELSGKQVLDIIMPMIEEGFSKKQIIDWLEWMSING